MNKHIEVHNRVSDFSTYRAARVKSLFNAENGCNFCLEIDADFDFEWNIGVVVGASGSGKTSIGKIIFDGENKIHDYTKGWSYDKPIIDCIAPDGDFNEVTGAVASTIAPIATRKACWIFESTGTPATQRLRILKKYEKR